MKAIFRDITGKKITIEIPKDKPFRDFKNEILTNFKIDTTKKEIKKVIYNKKELTDQSTLENIGYKDGDPISVMFTKVPDQKPKDEPPQEKKDQPKTETASQETTATNLPQNSQNTPPPAPSRPPLQPTDTGLPVQGQRTTNSQPYPNSAPTLDIIGLNNCFKIHDAMLRYNPDIVIRALESINPELYQRVCANPGPFLRMFGLQAAPEYANQMVQDVQQTLANYTPQERQAVQRLINMGYDAITVIQVFEAAGRDEETTAMILSNL